MTKSSIPASLNDSCLLSPTLVAEGSQNVFEGMISNSFLEYGDVAISMRRRNRRRQTKERTCSTDFEMLKLEAVDAKDERCECQYMF